jgi:hypothetical protein
MNPLCYQKHERYAGAPTVEFVLFAAKGGALWRRMEQSLRCRLREFLRRLPGTKA